MTDRRWYPTAITLSNGEALVIAGQIDGGKAATATIPASGERQSIVPEVWTGSAWRRLTGALQGLPWYPWMFAAPNGKVFYAGNTENNTTRYLDPSGAGSWSAPFTAAPQALSNFGAYLGQRYWGSAVLYERGQLLLLGGNGAAGTTNTTQLIDLTGPAGTPQFRPGAPMQYPRFHHNATVLPTGQVLVSGGTTNATNDADEYGVLPAELWTPPTGTIGGGTWQTVAALTEPRLYHSTAVLLPSGQVLTAGGGEGGAYVRHPTAQLYSPPYLFRGARPTVSYAPATIGYGQPFKVHSPGAYNIDKVTLIRLSSVTHSFNMNQRLNTLTFAANSDGELTITPPATANDAPPGHYMLFVVNLYGVPSEARIVQLGTATCVAQLSLSSTRGTRTGDCTAQVPVSVSGTANVGTDYRWYVDGRYNSGLDNATQINIALYGTRPQAQVRVEVSSTCGGSPASAVTTADGTSVIPWQCSP